MNRVLQRLRSNDDGALLLLTLAFITLLGLFCGAVLSYSDTSLRGHRSYVGERNERYAVDGAMEAAIEVLRDDLDAGRDPAFGGRCPDAEPFLTFPINGMIATAACAAEPLSGAPVSTGDEDPIVPEHSLLALGTHPDEGIARAGAVGLSLNGSIYSRSKITSTGVLTTAGKVYAVGTCSGTIVSLEPPLNCAPDNGVPLDDPLGADPSFDPAIRFAPAVQSVPVPATTPLGLPVCTGAVFTLQPGRYTDARALTTLTTECPGATIHLAAGANGPGLYVFDFEQVGGTDDIEDHVWRIESTGVRVVAGTPNNWLLGEPTVLPGACKTASDPAPNYGVQLIFSGSSRLDVREGEMEVCADSDEDEGAIAIYGMPELPEPVVVAYGENASGSAFTDPARTEGEIDDVWSIAADDAGAQVEAAFATTVPSGATIDQVTVSARHRESDGSNPRLVLVPGDGSGACPPIALTEDTTAHTDGAAGNGTSCISSLAKLSGMKARFLADTSAGWAKVDGFRLEVSLNGTEIEPLTGCLLAEPYLSAPATGAAGPCPVVHTEAGSIFAVQGTVYAPSAPIHLELGAASVQTVSQGIIARTIRFDATVGVAIPGNPVGSPISTARADRRVRITVSVGGVPRAEALVRFGDGGGDTPGATVDVLEWSFLAPGG